MVRGLYREHELGETMSTETSPQTETDAVGNRMAAYLDAQIENALTERERLDARIEALHDMRGVLANIRGSVLAGR
jgi:hypothetical protein